MSPEAERSADNPAALYPVGSVSKALGLLGLLKDRRSLRVTEVSRELGIAVSTAHRLLAMFEQFGFLEQHGRNSVYTIGSALLEISMSISGQLDIETAMRPFLKDLVREVNETALLCVLRGSQAVYLDAVESTHGVRAVSQTGRSLPAHLTAGGKALLAESSPADICRIYPAEYIGRLAHKPQIARSALLLELRSIRERGYAMDAEEGDQHLLACAAVVRDGAGVARASIVLAGPASRVARYEPGRLPAAVQAACAKASAALASAPGVIQRPAPISVDAPAAARRRE
jgi:DNA-binding IclR family transcriptional regulator